MSIGVEGLMNTPKAETTNTRPEDVCAQNKAAIHFTNIMSANVDRAGRAE